MAYFAIPLVLASFARRRRDLPFSWMFWMFGAFIIGCGTTHLMEVVTTYAPLYRLAGLVKLLTAAVSLATAALLVPLIPRALALRSPRELEREIEQRKRAEEALRQSEERFRLLVEGVQDYAIFLLDPQGRISSWNAGAQRIKGYTADEIIGQHFSRFYAEEDVQRGKPARELEEAAARGRCEDEGWRLRKDGSCFWANVIISALRDPEGNLKGFSKFTRDLTERKRAEEALRRAHEELEQRVRERTAELAAANEALRQEVSERQRAEEGLRRQTEALRRSEDDFRTLADNIPQLCWMARPDGHIFWYNKRWYDYTGATLEEMEGWGWEKVHDAAELKRVSVGWRRALAAGEPWEDTFPLRRHDGRMRWHLSRALPVRDNQGRVVRWFGSNTDITEQREMEAALWRAREELEERVRDRTADLAAANEALEARAGQQAAVARFGQRALAGTDLLTLGNEAAALTAEALGVEYTRVMELLPDGGRLLLRGGVGWKDGCVGQTTITAGKDSQVGFTLMVREPVVCADWRAESRFRQASLLADHGVVSSMTVVIPGEGRPYGVLAADAARRRDFSDDDRHFLQALAHVLATAIQRKRAEERAGAFAAELQRSNRELEQLASVASHDLQEPLRKIRAFGDRLQARFSEPLGEQGRQYIERMQSAAARMQTLIEDLLIFSRVTSKAQPFRDVDLAAEVRHVVSDLEARLQQTGGHVEVGELPTVRADATQMRQLLQNLIGNALKFHKPGELPAVRVEGKVVSGPGGDGGGRNGERCEITVRDNGIGFEQEYAERIFQLFQRLHGRSEYEGTGIGLAVCKKIVERHGGSITAASAPGQGSTFTITLPLKHSEEEGTA